MNRDEACTMDLHRAPAQISRCSHTAFLGRSSLDPKTNRNAFGRPQDQIIAKESLSCSRSEFNIESHICAGCHQTRKCGWLHNGEIGAGPPSDFIDMQIDSPAIVNVGCSLRRGIQADRFKVDEFRYHARLSSRHRTPEDYVCFGSDGVITQNAKSFRKHSDGGGIIHAEIELYLDPSFGFDPNGECLTVGRAGIRAQHGWYLQSESALVQNAHAAHIVNRWLYCPQIKRNCGLRPVENRSRARESSERDWPKITRHWFP